MAYLKSRQLQPGASRSGKMKHGRFGSQVYNSVKELEARANRPGSAQRPDAFATISTTSVRVGRPASRYASLAAEPRMPQLSGKVKTSIVVKGSRGRIDVKQ